MGMVVQHNMSAMNANRNLGVTAGNLAKSTEKLSSGYKINRAGDNAAGLAISEKMRGQIRGLDQASSNAEDGISMIQTAEGALTETHSILQRMRELSVQAASDTNTDDDRTQIQNEIDQLTQEVDRIATTTEFNTKKLIDGSAKGAVTEKAGKANVDSTFANSNVSAAITTDGSAKAAFTDVIRIEITEDFTAGKSTASTKKLDNDTIDKLNSLITGAGAAITFGSAAEGQVSITPLTAAAAAKLSTEEQIATAKEKADAALQTAKTAAEKSASAVKTNESAIDTTVDNIFKIAAKVDTADGSLLVEGTTKEDLKNAIKDYVSLLQENGTAAGAGTSPSITAAQNKLTSLFNTGDSTNKIGNVVAGTEDVAAAYMDATNTGQAKSTATAAATTADFGTVATDVTTKLDTFARAIAGVAITNDTNQKNLSKAQQVADAMSDTDLATAIVDYKKAETANAAIAGDSAERAQEKKDNIAAAKVALDKLNTDKSVMTVTDLFGNTDDSKKFEIGSKVDTDNNLTITLKNKEGDDTVITINNADKLKAGDVITITAKEMVETEQAPTGKDAFRLQVGANAGQEVMLGINSMKAKDLNIVQTKDGVEGKALDVTNQASASLAVNAYDMAIQAVSTERAKMGAMQNRLEHTIANLDTSSENLQSAESSLRDTDMAEEMTRYSKSNILQQAGQSMLAQANQSTQGVLNLLG